MLYPSSYAEWVKAYTAEEESYGPSPMKQAQVSPWSAIGDVGMKLACVALAAAVILYNDEFGGKGHARAWETHLVHTWEVQLRMRE
jgi:hypothetical protein